MEEYNSLEELYHRLLPCLKVKKRLIQNDNYLYISHNDIWRYLSTHKWKNAHNLTLSDMVSDIIYVNITNVDKYIKNKIKNEDKILL